MELTMDEVKRGRGRPPNEALKNLTRQQRVQYYKKKNNVKNLTINGDLLDRFNDSKCIESEKLGYELKNRQFLSILLQTLDNQRSRRDLMLERKKEEERGGF
jgi:hypothetical protein|tara:strand:+ start:1214 stop:1519 length:306 start_codon:yes stop_codon:yes gene_type:complete